MGWQWCSKWELWSRMISSSSRGFVELRSVRWRKKVWPAGIILVAKPSISMRDSSSCLVQEDRCSQEVRASLSLTRGRQEISIQEDVEVFQLGPRACPRRGGPLMCHRGCPDAESRLWCWGACEEEVTEINA